MLEAFLRRARQISKQQRPLCAFLDRWKNGDFARTVGTFAAKRTILESRFIGRRTEIQKDGWHSQKRGTDCEPFGKEKDTSPGRGPLGINQLT
jgi:hypothetical protein